jgi:alpha-tubulin suppressor-like RCC1 family protein
MSSGATAQAQGIPARLATGASHGVLLKADGSVWTWGANGDGQLGTAGDHAWAPAPVPGLDGIRGIAAGDRFTAAVKNDGTVWAWGENGSSRPAPVDGLAGVVAVAAAGRHALALRSDGTVWAWGDDAALGHSTLPAPVAGLTGVAAIAAADKHSVALKSDGTVWVWGDHGAGDLGNGTYGLSSVPLQLRGLSDVTAVAAG